MTLFDDLVVGDVLTQKNYLNKRRYTRCLILTCLNLFLYDRDILNNPISSHVYETFTPFYHQRI